MSNYLTDQEYDFIYSRSPRVCVDLLIVNEKKEVLLTKRDIEPYKDHWHFPGGRIKFRETIQEAIIRIAKSELGKVFDNSNLPLIGSIEFLDEEQKGQKRHSISLVYMAEMLSSLGSNVEILLDKQATEANFFSALPELVIPPQREFLIIQGWQ